MELVTEFVVEARLPETGWYAECRFRNHGKARLAKAELEQHEATTANGEPIEYRVMIHQCPVWRAR